MHRQATATMGLLFACVGVIGCVWTNPDGTRWAVAPKSESGATTAIRSQESANPLDQGGVIETSSPEVGVTIKQKAKPSYPPPNRHLHNDPAGRLQVRP